MVAAKPVREVIKYADGTPLANMHLSLLDKLGVRVEAHGNSTGPVSLD